MSFIVLGVDQSEGGNAGFAVVDLELSPPNNLVYTYLEEYRYTDKDGKEHRIPKSDKRTRCVRFALTLQRIIREYPPNALCTEIVRAYHHGQNNADTIAALSRIEAVMFLVAKHVDIYEFNTASWQALFLKPKRGDNRKVLSIQAVKQYYGLAIPEHVCDAIWIASAFPYLKDNPSIHITEVL